MGNVFTVVKSIGQEDVSKMGGRGFDDFIERPLASKQIATKFGKGKIRLATDGIVRKGYDSLAIGFVTNLGAA